MFLLTFGASRAIASDGSISVFIKCNNLVEVKEQISKMNGSVHSTIGNIITAKIPIQLVDQISKMKGVVSFETSQLVEVTVAKAAEEIHADYEYQHQKFESVYTGKGVIVGIVDTGIDYTHSDFFDASGKTRILYLWDQTHKPASGFSAPSEVESSYGIECQQEDLTNGRCPSIDRRGHGTHVAGIAAGGDDEYQGIAPDAKLIIVKNHDSTNGDNALISEKGEMQSSDVVDAVHYIFKKAKELGMPAVVNLSFAARGSRNDGRSLAEEALTELVEEDLGRVIVAAAGNGADRKNDDYLTGQHVNIQANNGSPVAVEMAILDPQSVRSQIDVWQEPGSNMIFTLGVKRPDSYIQLPWVAKGEVATESILDGRLAVIINSQDVD
ncbi:S8 family serine peptidase, partial [bacterium]|nr:S8 family serine peptidase [bacterium]